MFIKAFILPRHNVRVAMRTQSRLPEPAAEPHPARPDPVQALAPERWAGNPGCRLPMPKSASSAREEEGHAGAHRSRAYGALQLPCPIALRPETDASRSPV